MVGDDGDEGSRDHDDADADDHYADGGHKPSLHRGLIGDGRDVDPGEGVEPGLLHSLMDA